MDKKPLFRLSIGGWSFPIRFTPEEEFRYREAAKKVDRLYSAYRENYKENSLEQCAIMAAFQCSLEYMALREQRDESPMMDKIEEMLQLIESSEKE